MSAPRTLAFASNMVKSRLPANVDLSVSLSTSERLHLIDQAASVVAEAVRAERRFAATGCKPDKKLWKTVRSREDFQFYKSTKESRRASMMGTPSMTSWSSDDDENGVVASVKDPNVPMLMACSKLQGTIEDALFATFAGDELAWRERAAYAKDKFADSRFLATLQEPTPEKPFQYIVIKWLTKEQPPIVGSFVQHRDFLIVEANGYGIDEAGVPYGYHLVHSVTIPSIPEFTELSIIRSQVSLCLINRQLTKDTFRTFCRGFSDPRGALLETIAVNHTADTISGTMNTTEASYTKKLVWMLQQARQQRERDNTFLVSQRGGNNSCTGCQKQGSKLSTCQVCAQGVCSRCTVMRRIIVDVTRDGVTEHTLPFCLSCFLAAKNRSAKEVASARCVQRLNQHQASKARTQSATDEASVRPSKDGVVLYS
ncbi:hypothetical protein Poli38472_012613 [Pythium oligandrum]|uniref:START-like domain n=1 Tax=Pythium oligandrum TaxID=41045 RepID=A0A8K1CFX2_PYTOL|nr:hypothetical protein Poli38472_012613 [Pythium oligandrum]|eukprot:TMW61422.1 hypothetical protein Poli38472_012613 [Pythium oligandrum]